MSFSNKSRNSEEASESEAGMGQLKAILQKKSKFRSRKELLFIRKMLSSFKIFKDMEEFLNNKLMLQLCRELMYL